MRNITRTKQGNRLLDMVESDEVIDYVLDNFYDEVRQTVLENERDE